MNSYCVVTIHRQHGMTNSKDHGRGSLASSAKRDKGDDPKRPPKDVPQTKIVVRRLPPTLTADMFVEQVSPLPDYDYFNFVPVNKNVDKSLAYSRAYLHFVHYADVVMFKEKFDGYEFLDSKSNVYPAVVEFAPYQRVPKRARKPDPKMNTIDQDPDYRKFLEAYERSDRPRAPNLQELLQQVEATKAAEAATTNETPLLAYIKRKREEKRKLVEKQREERQRELERKKAREEEERQQRRRHQLEKEQNAAKEQQRRHSSVAASGSNVGAGDKVKKFKEEEKEEKQHSSEKAGDVKRSETKARDAGPHPAGDTRWQKQAPPQPSAANDKAVSAKVHNVSGGLGSQGKPASAKGSGAGDKTAHASAGHQALTTGKSTTSTPGNSASVRPSTAREKAGGGGSHEGVQAAGKPRPAQATPAGAHADKAASQPPPKDKPARKMPEGRPHSSSSYQPRPSGKWDDGTEDGGRQASRRMPGGLTHSTSAKSGSSAIRKDGQSAKQDAGGASCAGPASKRAGSEGATDTSEPCPPSGTDGSGASSERGSRGSSEEASVPTAAPRRLSGPPLSSQGALPEHGDGNAVAFDPGDLPATKNEDGGCHPSDTRQKAAAARREQQKARYKERPERAIYDPAARAAERRQKQAGRHDGLSSSDAKDVA